MSYSILYRHLFVRLSDGTFIPIIESGDNNVWESNTRRAREWGSCRWVHENEEQRKRFSLTGEEILDTIRNEINTQVENNLKRNDHEGTSYTREEILNNLSYYNAIVISGHRTTTAMQFLNFFKAGIKNAIPLDELGGPIRLSWYGEGFKSICEYAHNEAELRYKWDELIKKGIKYPYIGIDSVTAEDAWQKIKERNARGPRRKRENREYYIVSFKYGGGDGYLTKFSSRRIHFNPFADNAFKYASRKVAENACGKIKMHFPQLADVRILAINN